jgi:hypothetical protein
MTFALRILVLFFLVHAAGAAAAGSRDAVVVTRPPTDRGDAFVPGTRPVAELPRHAYVEEEFLVAGSARLFNYAHNPPTGPTDITAVQDDVPWETRMIVRRPADPADFDGTVVVEWWNSTAGFDTAPVWDASASYFARRGVVYVGVTNSTTSIDFLVGGCRLFGLLAPRCGTRYATLSLPENGLAYEMMNQISNLLRNGAGSSALPAAYEVRRLLHAGESQQAGSLVTYASAFHADDLADGYFLHSGINARPINGGPRCGDEGVPAFPDCTPRLAPPTNLVRSDLPVPVYQVVTQTDFETLGFGTAGRQADTPTFRYYEVPGGGHNVVHKGIELVPAGVLGPDPVLLENLCANPLNTVADGPVHVAYVINALWHRLIRQVANGNRAPPGQVMDVADGALVRDAYGNPRGGVRLPALDVPTATYGSTNVADPSLSPLLVSIGNLACRLSGSVFPFDEAQLRDLYADRDDYVARVAESARALEAQGLLLRSDAAKLRRYAERARLPLP